ncbi:nuclear transcription factor Y subunit A-10-like [Panicum miliaceum]|uniref:Nuclear transcription factor Y subunit A-10-like n=1 Tax=Panicum miliaceum TaxID=4540 RepID=A0A3L6T4D1_PANMI|nr:nuclear transcription factor Y subunit A-10-like [Panicum miliaceum]
MLDGGDGKAMISDPLMRQVASPCSEINQSDLGNPSSVSGLSGSENTICPILAVRAKATKVPEKTTIRYLCRADPRRGGRGSGGAGRTVRAGGGGGGLTLSVPTQRRRYNGEDSRGNHGEDTFYAMARASIRDCKSVFTTSRRRRTTSGSQGAAV